MSSMPALALAGAAGGMSAAAAPSLSSWLKAGVSAAVLAPLTVDRLPYGGKPTWAKPSALDDAEDSKPYVLAEPARVRGQAAAAGVNNALNLWRKQIGGIQKLFRKASQAAYLISVPFLMMILLGAIVGNRSIALMGATAAVILNIGRVVAGLANLALVPVRDGVNVKKLRKPFWRVAEPAATIAAVVLAFTFIPSLSRADKARGNLADRLREGALDLKADIKGEVQKHADVDRLGSQAREQLEKLGDQARQLDVNKLGAEAQSRLRQLAPGSSEVPGPSTRPAGKNP